MTKEDIIRLARDAGFADGVVEIVGLEGFSRFAELVAAHQRERILEMCKEGWWDGEGIRYHLEKQDAIRSRT